MPSRRPSPTLQSQLGGSEGAAVLSKRTYVSVNDLLAASDPCASARPAHLTTATQVALVVPERVQFSIPYQSVLACLRALRQASTSQSRTAPSSSRRSSPSGCQRRRCAHSSTAPLRGVLRTVSRGAPASLSPRRGASQVKIVHEFTRRLALPSGEFIGFVLKLNKVRRRRFGRSARRFPVRTSTGAACGLRPRRCGGRTRRRCSRQSAPGAATRWRR